MGTSAAAFERELYLHERVLAAGGAGTLSSVLVNPLDVVKTRMQAQATTSSRIPPKEHFTCAALETRNWVLANGHYTWPTRTSEPPVYVPRPPLAQYRSTLDGLVKIWRTEGYKVLYRGMDINLLVGVPMVCMYLPAYDKLSSYFQSQGAGSLSPLLAGSFARTVAVLATSPVELLKTRLQTAPASGPSASGKATASYITVWQSLALHRQPTIVGKVRTLWTGVGASLLKDVPFAALYWSLMEPVKSRLQKSELFDGAPNSKTMLVNATSGATAGGLAAALTIPFDVVKTHTQTSHQHSPDTPPMSVARATMDIARQRGWTALFAGCMPRSVRTAVAYAILMASYEQCKQYCVQPPPLYPSTVNQ